MTAAPHAGPPRDCASSRARPCVLRSMDQQRRWRIRTHEIDGLGLRVTIRWSEHVLHVRLPQRQKIVRTRKPDDPGDARRGLPDRGEIARISARRPWSAASAAPSESVLDLVAGAPISPRANHEPASQEADIRGALSAASAPTNRYSPCRPARPRARTRAAEPGLVGHRHRAGAAARPKIHVAGARCAARASGPGRSHTPWRA